MFVVLYNFALGFFFCLLGQEFERYVKSMGQLSAFICPSVGKQLTVSVQDLF